MRLVAQGSVDEALSARTELTIADQHLKLLTNQL